MLTALLALMTATAGDDDPWRALWLGMAESTTTCSEFDYFPNGGMRSAYCHLRSQMGDHTFRELAPSPIFRSGPHSLRALDLDNPREFGHYNPAFVRWLGDTLVPAASDPAFRAQTQSVYDSRVAPLARIHYQTHQKLNAPENAACTAKEKKRYVQYMETGQGAEWGAYYERWFFYMNPAFCSYDGPSDWYYDNGFDGGVSGNVVKTTVGFWLRRSIDNTDDEFFSALVKLLETYDAAWLSAQSRK